MHRPRLGTLCALCLSIAAVGPFVERLPWLAGITVVVQQSPAQFPSSLAVPPHAVRDDGSLLSVYTATRYLYDPGYGLLANPGRVGRDWEHPATVSFFRNGELLFASNAGLRLHGGKSRFNSPVQSFRLYFRREYGSARFRPGTLFGGRADPLTRLVAHNDLRRDDRGLGNWWRMVNPLAYDIARRIGALAPETLPAAFVLNGVPQGLYVLTEHVRKPFLVSRFGHDNFDHADLPPEAVVRALTDLPRFTMAEASAWIDVENLTRWLVSVLFCATTDPFQAVRFRDRTGPDSRWFWVNWDMDHSFMDLYRQADRPWRHDTFRTTLGRRAFESRIVTRLLEDDPAYRRHLADAVLDALNYRLTPAFLDERYSYYRQIVESSYSQFPDREYLDVLDQFLTSRPAHLRELLVRHVDIPPLHRLRLGGSPGVSVRINGHTVDSGFSGWYVAGTEIRIELARPGEGFSHWTVNDRTVTSPEIRQRITGDLTLTAEWHAPGPSAGTPPRAAR